VTIAIFFVLHWQSSVFFQSFFQHRYGAHGQFTMSPRWERVFHFMAWFTQGPSYLSPRAYAILHRMHHAYSDTPKDPHSPIHEPNLVKMMWRTGAMYSGIKNRTLDVESRFDDGRYPSWPLLDKTQDGWAWPLAWGAAYALFYCAFATSWWQLLLLPIHWTMGPIHGAIVNYFGHKVGYRNFTSSDDSRNTLPFDFLTMGELFQNNHHKFGQSPTFAARWFEIDPAYLIIRTLAALGVIQLRGASYSSPRAPQRGPQRRSLQHPDSSSGAVRQSAFLRTG
jgi:stearoyl-CoA desaturase (delta-9 desaturase)